MVHERGLRLKKLLGLLAVLIVVGGAFVMWYVNVPHTAEQQFAAAERLDKVLQGDAATKSAGELGKQIAETCEQYRRVGTRFGKSDKAAEGLKRIADIQEKIAKDDGKAIETLEELLKDYPAEGFAGHALLEEGRILHRQADEMREKNPGDALGKYKEALGKFEEYRKRFEKGKDGDRALMEIGRVWQDGIREPLIRQLETFEQFLKEYKESEYRAEAMYRLGKALEALRDFQRAMDIYASLLDEYPKSPFADQARFARGKILAEEMKKHDEAAKEFERLQQESPESPLGQAAGGEARRERQQDASGKEEAYGKSRYGGSMPVDTTMDKPRPPAGMLKQFRDQKLDALDYDLVVEFVPEDHRINVSGTLTLTNHGEEKSELLMMFGIPMKMTKLTFDGVEVKSAHQGETLRITLASPFKKEATGKMAFEYTGQYAAPAPDEASFMEATGMKKEGPAATGTAPATRPEQAAAAGPPATNALKLRFDLQMALGEYGYGLSGASWYPVTIIGDLYNAHVVFKTPANMEAVGNGTMVRRAKSTEAGKEGEFEFQTKSPIFGLYFAYGPYVMQEKQLGAIHYYSYFKKEDAGKHEAFIDVTNKILSFYSEKFAPFPYEKMAMIEAPLPPMLGGVGPASLMFLHERLVGHSGVPENLLAHELAHQWFGNLIPINIADPGYNQWLSEGFATYCDALYTEKTAGHEAFVKHMEQYGQLYFQFLMTAPQGMGVIGRTGFNSPALRPVIYEKGAVVLHMLRKVMGDEKFFAMMRKYVATYRDKGTTVDDFRHLASEEYGKELSWFFDQWIDRAVFAHWTIDVKTAEAGGETKVTMQIEQAGELVRAATDITILGADPKEREVIKDVMLESKDQKVETTVKFKPVKVIIDEEYWVLRHPGSDNIWPAEKAPATSPAQ